MTYVYPYSTGWIAMYVNGQGEWSTVRNALHQPIICASESLAASVARYRRRRLRSFK